RRETELPEERADLLAKGLARVGAIDDADERDADLDGREKAAGIHGERECRGSARMRGRCERAQARHASRYNRQLRKRKNAVEENESRDDEKLDHVIAG